MNGLVIIYIIGALAIGVLIGMIVELILDNQTIMELQEKNRKLRLENAQLRQKGTKEVIEIIDRRTPETDFSFPNTEGL